MLLIFSLLFYYGLENIYDNTAAPFDAIVCAQSLFFHAYASRASFYYYYYVIRFYVPLLVYANAKRREGQQNTNKTRWLSKQKIDSPAMITAMGNKRLILTVFFRCLIGEIKMCNHSPAQLGKKEIYAFCIAYLFLVCDN